MPVNILKYKRDAFDRQHFNICITILEARNLAWPNMTSVVCIQVGNDTKYTKTKKYSDRPFFNEYFVFDYHTTLSELLNKNIILTVLKPRGKITFRSRLGSARLDVGTVWFQEGHELNNKWIALTNPTDPVGQVQGFLKCVITVKSKIDDEPLIRPVHVQNVDSNIEGNIFVPENILLGKQKARYLVNIYRAYAIGKKTLKQRTEVEKDKDLQALFVQISFGGLSCCTTKRQFTRSPEWNERLIFTEAYPPLYQRLRIDVLSGKKTIATRFINFNDISSDTVDWFPPMFGPSFVHLYSTDDTYRGSLLISIETTIVLAFTEGEYMQGAFRHVAAPLKEALYWRMKEFLCFAVVYDVSMLDNKITTKKNVKISICFGSNETNAITKEYMVVEGNCEYNWIPIGEEKPCLFLRTSQPDSRNRMFLSNILSAIANSLETQIKAVEKLASGGFEFEANELLDKALNDFKKCWRKLSLKFPVGLTQLDKSRAKIISSKMDDMISSFYEQVVFENKLLAAKTCVNKTLQLVTDPQDSLPAVQISLWVEDKLIGSCNILAKDIIYSTEKRKRGIYCAKLNTHKLKYLGNNHLAGLVDIYLWLGTWKEVSRCLHSVPKGHQDLIQLTELPSYFIYSKYEEFVCCCHLYQGQLEPGWTKEDLYNCFVKVFVHNNCVQTEVKPSTLNPLWEEMLILPINVYPSIEYIKKNPPKIVLEVWHKGIKDNLLLGRIVIKPYVDMNYPEEDRKGSFEWIDIIKETKVSGRILGSFEMVEKSALLKAQLKDEVTDHMLKNGARLSMPNFISPQTISYRIEVKFWGIREKNKSLKNIQVVLSCGDLSITSICKDNKFLNFDDPVFINILELPELEEYSPPLIIRAMDIRSFGSSTYVGTHVVRNIHKFSLKLPTKVEWSKPTSHRKTLIRKLAEINILDKGKDDEILEKEVDSLWKEEDQFLFSQKYSSTDSGEKLPSIFDYFEWIHNLRRLIRKGWINMCKYLKIKDSDLVYYTSKSTSDDSIKQVIEEYKYDWWTKYVGAKKRQESSETRIKFRTGKSWLNSDKKVDMSCVQYEEPDQAFLKLYYNELEAQAEFEGFFDVLKSFKIIRGKSQLDYSSVKNVSAKLKLALCIYPWPPTEECVTPTGLNVNGGVLRNTASNVPRKVLVRVYVVKAYNLRSTDPNNIVDPYIELATHSSVVSDSNNYISQQLNPVFGRSLEMVATFPQDSILTVRVKDWDRFTSHEVIGETVIDLENRYYSFHRGTCGLPVKFNLAGYNQWRDIEKPCDILESMCLENNIPLPEYFYNSIVIGNKEFQLILKDKSSAESIRRQKLALLVLNNWSKVPVVGKHLVPEHVETRSLFIKDKPGMEQGKLEMWVDMFDLSVGIPPPPINIKPRDPEKFELRVVILNTAKVLLIDEGLFVGEKHCDIYVKGWLTDPDKAQVTDVHYMSVNGDGYFNWRFVFPFSYITSEERMIVFNKETFQMTEVEYKVPAVLNLQVWDKDRISQNDFIGSLTMELCRIPRGAPNWRLFKINQCIRPASTLDLFKVKTVRGWWPFLTSSRNTKDMAGYVEAELTLLTEEEAIKAPAGLGRNEPNALLKPFRPVYKFKFWMAPFHMLNYMLCKANKRRTFVCLISTAAGLFIFIGIYSIPVFIIKRIMGA